MTILPRDLFRFMPFLPDTFDKAEKEFAATLVVLWHYDMKHDDWTPVSPKAVIEWAFETDLRSVKAMRSNPFVRPDFVQLAADGYVDGWENVDAIGVFSAKGLERLERLVNRP